MIVTVTVKYITVSMSMESLRIAKMPAIKAKYLDAGKLPHQATSN